jgi:NADH dehydrogenase (ubiquinone) 1 alpha/beta subcomplex 1
MFRAAIPTFRAIARSTTAAAAVRPQAAQRIVLGQRWYAASAGLDKEQITSRVLEVLKGFEKVDGGKVSCAV